jgi:large subunit ribosomal protein L13
MKTYSAKPLEVERKWLVVDAAGQTLGRLASTIAALLRGKHKPEFTPHIDTGDFVIVINASQVKVTGKKAEQKNYYRNSGYPGGLRTTNFEDLLAKSPEKVIEYAVWGMIPHTRLGRQQIRKLHVFAGAEHPHQAQKPEVYELKALEAVK